MKRSKLKDSPQRRATRNYRSRLEKRGLARFEVLGLDSDRDLVRSIAKRLAEDGPQAMTLRATVRTMTSPTSEKGGILAALRRSPLVGADVAFVRERVRGRKIKL